MLTQLNIKNFGLIEDLTIEFACGLNVLTGTTGAGKSIIIDGLRFVLGERLNTSQIRDVAQACGVEAVFDLRQTAIGTEALFQDFVGEDQLLVINRQYLPDGRSKIRVNGQVITLGQLKTLGDHLVDFHGPHDHQMLLSEDAHLGLLDRLADFGPLKTQYTQSFQEYAMVQGKIADLTGLASARDRELDLLQHQLHELAQVPLTEEKYLAVWQELQRVNNAGKIYEFAAAAIAVFSDGDQSVAERLGQAFSSLRGLAQIDGSAEPFLATLGRIQNDSDELLTELRRYLDRSSFSPQEAAEINRQFDIYEDIRRKYGPSLDDAARFYEQAKQRYDLLQNWEHNRAQLENQQQKLETELTKLAAEISRIRQKTGLKLKKTIETELRELGIAQVVFETRIEREKFGVAGWDRVTFFISPNTGEELKPLAVIVSSGEAARVMLAMKKALIKVDPIPVLIFDEIDAQIGGRLGEITGRKLQEISTHRQVVLITHLPQIASFADRHFKVQKSVRAGRTTTTVQILDKPEQLQELAQMLSGENKTSLSLSYAQEMLAKAQKS